MPAKVDGTLRRLRPKAGAELTAEDRDWVLAEASGTMELRRMGGLGSEPAGNDIVDGQV